MIRDEERINLVRRYIQRGCAQICASVSFLPRAMLYKTRYLSHRVSFSSHPSSWKRTLEPFLSMKDPKWKRFFFAAIERARKYKSPNFQHARDRTFGLKYFFHMRVCHSVLSKKLVQPFTKYGIIFYLDIMYTKSSLIVWSQTTSHLASL